MTSSITKRATHPSRYLLKLAHIWIRQDFHKKISIITTTTIKFFKNLHYVNLATTRCKHLQEWYLDFVYVLGWGSSWKSYRLVQRLNRKDDEALFLAVDLYKQEHKYKVKILLGDAQDYIHEKIYCPSYSHQNIKIFFWKVLKISVYESHLNNFHSSWLQSKTLLMSMLSLSALLTESEYGRKNSHQIGNHTKYRIFLRAQYLKSKLMCRSSNIFQPGGNPSSALCLCAKKLSFTLR